jgi:hypothetical protein
MMSPLAALTATGYEDANRGLEMRGFSLRLTAPMISALTFALSFSANAQARDFKIVGNTEQTQQIEQSLAACPSLGERLDALSKSAGFQQIRVSTADETKKTGPFLAVAAGNEIIVADSWLALQNQPYFDVRHAGEILPDNLCFDLGHLSDHIAHPAPMSPSGTDLKSWVDQRLKAESLAFIRGWPFVLEAARAKNNGQPLTPAQFADLLLNLRYRFAFLQAMKSQTAPRLSILPDGSIPETDANVAAIQAALSHSSIADLQ